MPIMPNASAVMQRLRWLFAGRQQGATVCHSIMVAGGTLPSLGPVSTGKATDQAIKATRDKPCLAVELGLGP